MPSPQNHMGHHITEKEVKRMIDAAIDHHNRTASLISMTIGFTLLGFYADGVMRVVDLVIANL